MKTINFKSPEFSKDEIEYLNNFDSLDEVWHNCYSGSIMLRIAFKLGVDNRLLTKAKVLCANTARHLMAYDESKEAVDAALRYAGGEIDSAELKKYTDETACR